MGIGDSFSNIDEIIPNLFITDLSAVQSSENLIARNITHLLSIFEGPVTLPSTSPPLKQLHIHLHDRASEDLLGEFSRTTSFIREALDEGGRVIVHCLMGISRSPTVVAAYLIATQGLSAGEAVEQVRRKRKVIAPNMGFLLQLEDYSAVLRAEEEANRKIAESAAAAAVGTGGVGGVTADGQTSVESAKI